MRYVVKAAAISGHCAPYPNPYNVGITIQRGQSRKPYIPRGGDSVSVAPQQQPFTWLMGKNAHSMVIVDHHHFGVAIRRDEFRLLCKWHRPHMSLLHILVIAISGSYESLRMKTRLVRRRKMARPATSDSCVCVDPACVWYSHTAKWHRLCFMLQLGTHVRSGLCQNYSSGVRFPILEIYFGPYNTNTAKANSPLSLSQCMPPSIWRKWVFNVRYVDDIAYFAMLTIGSTELHQRHRRLRQLTRDLWSPAASKWSIIFPSVINDRRIMHKYHIGIYTYRFCQHKWSMNAYGSLWKNTFKSFVQFFRIFPAQ